MRLLPGQKGVDPVRTFSSFRPDIFGPARSPAANSPGGLSCDRQDLAVEVETPHQQILASPQREMSRVPPVHFKVKLSVPTVLNESGFLRGQRASAIDGGLILRKHDAPLQLRPAAVVAARQIDGASRRPEFFPVLRSSPADLVKGGQFPGRIVNAFR